MARARTAVRLRPPESNLQINFLNEHPPPGPLAAYELLSPDFLVFLSTNALCSIAPAAYRISPVTIPQPHFRAKQLPN